MKEPFFMTNEKIKIEDNFLDQEEFDKLQDVMLGQFTFPWYYNNFIDFEDVKDVIDNFMFTHMFYSNSIPTDNSIQFLSSIIKVLNPLVIFKIKANLQTRTPHINENEFHADIGGITKEQIKQWTTSIFYMNTNDGYTEFKNGTRVKSVANRMLSFPTDMEHRGTSCTNENLRVVINFNYIKKII